LASLATVAGLPCAQELSVTTGIPESRLGLMW
jgi:hypothetical protein